jgi:hypothetical protein
MTAKIVALPVESRADLKMNPLPNLGEAPRHAYRQYPILILGPYSDHAQVLPGVLGKFT